MANRKHLDILRQGVETWNKWRDKHIFDDEREPDLSAADLRRADLRRARLLFADLSGANLSAANLLFANLCGARLIRANLSAVNLGDADLSAAQLQEADLSAANLSAVDLTFANLSGADLTFANLSAADLSGADLSGADLSNANLRAARLLGTRGADLSNAINISNEASFYYNRGWAHYDRKEYGKAISNYDRAIARNLNYADAYNKRGLAYYLLKQYQEALSDYNRAIELGCNSYATFYNRGRAYYDLKEYSKAIVEFSCALTLNPNFAPSHYYRGEAHYGLKEYQKAITDYDRAIELNPGFAKAYHYRGLAYYGLKEYQKAITNYDQAIQLDSSLTEARSSREKAEEALRQGKASIENGKLALAQGQLQEAAITYTTVAQLEPNNPQAHLGFAQASLALEDFDAVYMACCKVQELQPTGGLERSLAQVLMDLLDQKYDRAQQAIDQYTTQDFTNGYAHALRAYLLSITGKSYDADLARADAAHLSQGATFEKCFPPEAVRHQKGQWRDWTDISEDFAGVVYPILVSLKVGHPDITAAIAAGLISGVTKSLKEGRDPRKEKTVLTILQQVVKAATPVLTADLISEVIKHIHHS